jgi:regulator of sigma E protease
MITFFAFIVVFSILVFFHELGHFIAAKSVGIKVEEFALGYGPQLLGFTLGDTLYSVRVLPLGGFCKMAGEDMDDDSMEPLDVAPEQLFKNKTVLQRMLTVAAGPLLNFVLAILLFAIVFSSVGVPAIVINEVLPGWPAEVAGIREGDEIVAVNGKGPSIEEIIQNINASAGQVIDVTIIRDGKRINLEAVPKYNPESQVGQLGITLAYSYVKRGAFKTFLAGMDYTVSTARLILQGIWQMITGRIKADVAGPVGIVQMVGATAQYGILPLLFFTARLSVNLGVLNLFPIPILDGGWILFLALEGLRGRPVQPRYQGFAQLVGVGLLLLLLVFATYRDISRLASF